MASIKQRPDGSWRARYRDHADKEHARHFGTKKDAQAWLDPILGDLARGTYVDPAGAKRRFRDVADEWQASKVWRPSTRALVESHFENHVYPVLGDRRIGAIRPSQVQAFVKGLSDELAPATVTTIMRFVSQVFRVAVSDRIIASSPCVGITLPRREKARIVPLTNEQLDVLEAALPARYQALVVVGAGLGLRHGEAIALTLDRVDWLRRRVTIDRQLVTPPGGGEPTFEALKTEASARQVPLPEVVAVRLARHIEEHGTGPDGLLFTNERGKPISRNRWGETWRAAVAAAGLPKGTRYHDLRHHYASCLIAAGVSVRAVAGALGHTDPGITLRVYSHLWPSDEDKTRDAIDLALAGESADSADFSRTEGAENP